MLTLSATKINIDKLTHLGVCHGGIDTAVNDRGKGVS